ncbi:MAG: SCO1664 family protein [Actinomycetota bacterium]|nr:SCO1664 family protein [Actinomycetota bacterium]
MTPAAAVDVLTRGRIEVHGRIAGSSNVTLLVTCSTGEEEGEGGGEELLAVYKPLAGERELWDFPPGLHRREVAAWLLSEWLGWGIVPETVLRTDAPFGEGSLQRVVDEDGVSHYFTLRDDPRWHPALRRIAAFDVLANNADRKSGHVLRAGDRLWAIDHGLTFHAEPKLRTVIWDFAGDSLDEEVLCAVGKLAGTPLPAALAELLGPGEAAALVRRARSLLAARSLPAPGPGRPYPWPLV